MIYNPAHGDLAFTVPLFNEFMIRQMRRSSSPAMRFGKPSELATP